MDNPRFIHQHISDENVVRFFAPEYKMRAALAVCVAECDPAKMPKVPASGRAPRLRGSQDGNP